MLVVLTAILLFVCIPTFGAGLWIVLGQRQTAIKALGGVIVLLGSAPALLWLLFLYYLAFHTT